MNKIFDMAVEINRKDYDRFIVLDALYKEVDGATKHIKALDKIAAKIDIKNGYFSEIFNWLADEKLIVNDFGQYNCQLSHDGLKTVEFHYKNTTEKSDYFPSLKAMGF